MNYVRNFRIPSNKVKEHYNPLNELQIETPITPK